MDLSTIIPKDGIIPSLEVASKKEALQQLSKLASEITGLTKADIHHALLQREHLGSTGLGRGIAVPHVKFADLKTIVCIFVRLSRPIPFESLDNENVDLLFLLLSPEHASGDHLKMLARISRIVREPFTLEQLRKAKGIEDIRRVLYVTAAPHAA